jgi:hypothetical protein
MIVCFVKRSTKIGNQGSKLRSGENRAKTKISDFEVECDE